jgi:hypothetical protein
MSLFSNQNNLDFADNKPVKNANKKRENNVYDIPDTIYGRVIVDGTGCVYDGEDDFSFVNFSGKKISNTKTAEEKSYKSCGAKGQLVCIKNKSGTVIGMSSKSDLPGVNNSKVSKSGPGKFSPAYYRVKFDDGSYGHDIHEKFLKKSQSGGKTRKAKKLVKKNRRTRRR